jgi:hypothetical protein
MIARLRAFARFWYHFLVGDDWTVAAGVVLALAATYAVSRTALPSWWIVPAVAVLLLVVSVARTRPSPRKSGEAKIGL